MSSTNKELLNKIDSYREDSDSNFTLYDTYNNSSVFSSRQQYKFELPTIKNEVSYSLLRYDI